MLATVSGTHVVINKPTITSCQYLLSLDLNGRHIGILSPWPCTTAICSLHTRVMAWMIERWAQQWSLYKLESQCVAWVIKTRCIDCGDVCSSAGGQVRAVVLREFDTGGRSELTQADIYLHIHGDEVRLSLWYSGESNSVQNKTIFIKCYGFMHIVRWPKHISVLWLITVYYYDIKPKLFTLSYIYIYIYIYIYEAASERYLFMAWCQIQAPNGAFKDIPHTSRKYCHGASLLAINFD